MRTFRFRRVLLATVAAALVAPLASFMLGQTAVAGGGGCHSDRLTGARATEVPIVDGCFTPTVAYVDVGATVEWTNTDDLVHAVTGANASFGTTEEMGKGDVVEYPLRQRRRVPVLLHLPPGHGGRSRGRRPGVGRRASGDHRRGHNAGRGRPRRCGGDEPCFSFG